MAQIKAKFIENAVGRKRDSVEVKVNQGFLDLVNGIGSLTEAAMADSGLTKVQIKALQRGYTSLADALENSSEVHQPGFIGSPWEFYPSSR